MPPLTPSLRCCLLSGGASRRMGTDKALLPHPEGGTWLERTLRLLLASGAPVTLLSHHAVHRRLAPAGVTALDEPPPREGPLLALGRLMVLYPCCTLLLCPVDMPWLRLETLEELIAAGRAGPAGSILTAHDGLRDQPLLGLYPATATHRAALERFSAAGGRSLLAWLAQVGHRRVALPAEQLRNCNRPDAWEAG